MSAVRVALLALLAPSLFAQSAPSAREVAGYDALQRAAHEGDVGTLSKLLGAGADRSIADGAGVTPLEHARRHGYDEIVTMLERE